MKLISVSTFSAMFGHLASRKYLRPQIIKKMHFFVLCWKTLHNFASIRNVFHRIFDSLTSMLWFSSEE